MKDVTSQFGSLFRVLVLDQGMVAKTARKVDKVGYEQTRAFPELGYWPDIEQPKRFNEKVLNRMLVGKNELFTTATDKIKSREYVQKKCSEKILPEVYHVTDDPETIPFEMLPESYLIKSSFGSGRIILIDEDDTVNKKQIIRSCNKWLSKNDYTHKAVVRGHYNFDYDKLEKNKKVFVEERLVGNSQDLPRDYKFYVFHGDVEYVHVDSDRFDKRTMRFFDREWNAMEFQKGGNPLGPVIDKPPCYDRMIEIAERLGEELDFIRVDLYHTRNNEVIFGELTPNPGAGKSPFKPSRVDTEFGKLW